MGLPTELAQMRDELIAQRDGAVKFEPMIEVLLARAIEDLPLSETGNKSREQIVALAVPVVAGKRAEILAAAEREHAKFIAQLRTELQTDPDGRGYAGMTDEEIAAEMTEELEVTEDQLAPSEMEQLVTGVRSSLAVMEGSFAITRDGRVLDHAGLQAEIDAAIIATRKTREELIAPRTVERVAGTRPAPCWRVIGGVQYGRNLVRIEEIREARR